MLYDKDGRIIGLAFSKDAFTKAMAPALQFVQHGTRLYGPDGQLLYDAKDMKVGVSVTPRKPARYKNAREGRDG